MTDFIFPSPEEQANNERILRRNTKIKVTDRLVALIPEEDLKKKALFIYRMSDFSLLNLNGLKEKLKSLGFTGGVIALSEDCRVELLGDEDLEAIGLRRIKLDEQFAELQNEVVICKDHLLDVPE